MDILTGRSGPDTGPVKGGERNISALRLSEAQIARPGIGRKFKPFGE
ncbi:hypothetical protein [Acuticoccus sp.]